MIEIRFGDFRTCALAVVVLLVGVGAAFNAVHAQAFVAPNQVATLRPGDAVRITVWRHPDLSGEIDVGQNGALVHPLYQEVQVAGVPLGTVQEKLTALLREYETNPRVVIEPLFHVTVEGAVRQPNVYMLAAGTTVADAIARAGGATDVGRLDKVELWRASQSRTLDLTSGADAVASLAQSGDRIVVGRRRNLFRDVIGPTGSVLALAVSVANYVVRKHG